MDSPEFQPTLDIFEGDIEILGVFFDKSCDTLPANGAVFSEEMVIIWQCFHICKMRRFEAIGKLDFSSQLKPRRRLGLGGAMKGGVQA